MPKIVNDSAKLAKKIGDAIKKLRMTAGYKSSETFALKHSLPRVHYWRMESGTNFTLRSLCRVLDCHGVSVVDFMASLDKK